MSYTGYFRRIHIEKNTKSGVKNTTISIETLSYELLCLKLNTEPYSKESNMKIRKWVTEKIESDPSYDPDAPYAFSHWLKRIILLEIASSSLLKRWKEKGAT